MTIGFFGAPSRPMVDPSGIPISMCVAWIDPVERLSRMAAQFAPFVTVELMPYFLKRPFSCAMTIGEQSVSAMIPKLMFGVSGPSPVAAAVAAHDREPSAVQRAAAPTPVAARVRNWRRLREAAGLFPGMTADVGRLGRFMQVLVGKGGAMEVFAKEAAGQIGLGKRWCEQTGADELTLQRLRFGQRRHIGFTAVENMKIRHRLDAVVTAIKKAEKRRRHDTR